MRIVFIGQAAFGKDSLDRLIQQGENVVGAITVAGKAGQPVKEAAESKQLPVLQPGRLKNSEPLEWVRRLAPDLLVLAFVTDFVPKEMIALSTFGGINYHPSLLPKYRGGSAINWAIIKGETETGVTIHQIDDGVDTGPIVLQQKVAIAPDDTVKTLYFQKLYPLGVEMVAQAVRLIGEGRARPVPQDHSQASFQPVIKESDVIIDWFQSTRKIYDMIRGSNPSPGAVSWVAGEKIKIWEAKPWTGGGNPGEIVEITSAHGVEIATGDGSLLAQRVEYRDSGKIPAGDLIPRLGLKAGDRLG